MRHMKKILTVLLAAVMLICMSVSAVWAEGEEVAQQTTADNMSFDVIFAIDGSGSMKKSDALKLRLTAGRLFTEMTYSNTSRAGFVQFTNIIMDSQGLTDLSTEDSKASFRDRLSGLQDSVKGSWDTDISLGLTQALNLLKEGDSFNGDRNPMIILLSDGNTDLPNGPRTVEESNAELTGTLSEAASLGVPIYSIGLNYDGKLDVDYMQNIANQTGGAFYNITTATDFNKYMTDIFGNALSIAGSFMDSDLVNRFMMVIFAVILVFGVLNCILGYRLLRFWMMLGGFLVGGGLALVVVHTMGIQEKSTMLIAALAAGVVFAVIAFLIYKAGVFILAAGIGWAASIYFLHPTSSAVFFACILIGVALGSMAVKYCREVLIVATSLIGGIMAGVSLAQLGNLADIPYGLGMSVGFAVLGMLIQFAINKPVSDEEDEETVDEESTEQIYRRNQELRQDQSFEQSQDRDVEESIYARGQKGQARKNGKRS